MTRSPIHDVGAAIGFLTVVGRSATPTAAAMSWFPVVGAVVGGAVGLAWWGAAEVWPPLLAAVVAIVVDLVLTGALHHDGLADSADGLLPHMDRERRLDVMRQPDVGTFGAMALIATTAVRIGALSAVEPRPALLAGIWCASRTVMATAARRVPYARSRGLATDFLGGSAVAVAVTGALLAGLLAIGSDGWIGVACLAAVAICAAAVVALAMRRIGGFTGDVLGAAGLVGETGALLAMAARW
ncbi:MAG: adenosylcobinamide-GDP ribazoletransferase [Acidimicrobiia bacterium]|nr:adenosylcobinamide-GDP ribazoletransferase [Acidimicrobiia bacterium]